MEVRTHLVYEFLCSDEPPKKLAMPLVFQESPTLPQLRATTSKRTSIKISSTISWVQTWMKVSNMSWQHLQIRKCQYKKGVPVLLKDFGTVFWKSTLQHFAGSRSWPVTLPRPSPNDVLKEGSSTNNPLNFSSWLEGDQQALISHPACILKVTSKPGATDVRVKPSTWETASIQFPKLKDTKSPSQIKLWFCQSYFLWSICCNRKMIPSTPPQFQLAPGFMASNLLAWKPKRTYNNHNMGVFKRCR